MSTAAATSAFHNSCASTMDCRLDQGRRAGDVGRSKGGPVKDVRRMRNRHTPVGAGSGLMRPSVVGPREL